MAYLGKHINKLALLDVSEDTQITQPSDIVGFEIVAVVTPPALDGVSNDINRIEIDPGNGTFYQIRDNAGALILVDPWFLNVAADEYLVVPTEYRSPTVDGPGKLVGARARLHLSEVEDADRNFFLILLALDH